METIENFPWTSGKMHFKKHVRPCSVALGHGVSAQQGVLKVAHSGTLGGLRPRLWRGGSCGVNLLI